jgi:hypothetical protein
MMLSGSSVLAVKSSNLCALFYICIFLNFRYNRFENNREASLQAVKVPAGQVPTANQKPPMEASGDSLIDLSDEAAPSVITGGASVPSLNTKLAGLGTFTG